MEPMSTSPSSVGDGERRAWEGGAGAGGGGGETAGSSLRIITTWGGLRRGATGWGRGATGGRGLDDDDPGTAADGEGCWLPVSAITTGCSELHTVEISSEAMDHQRHLHRLAWPQVEQFAAQPGSTVVWPWGAVEQHGPHLPLGTDGVFAERVLDAVLAGLDPELPVLRLPLQSIGFSPEHQGFTGTLSLSPTWLIEATVAVGQQLAGAGFQRLVLFNAHGGQIGLLQTAARHLGSVCPELAVFPCFLWSGPEGIGALIPEPERSEGLHAGLAETSLMLHLAPQLVGQERPCDGTGLSLPQGWSLEEAAPLAWLTHNLSATGVIGDARGASASLGAQLFDRLVAGWQQRLDALLRSPWPAVH